MPLYSLKHTAFCFKHPTSLAFPTYSYNILRGLWEDMTIFEYLPFEDQMTNLKVCSQNHPGNASSQNSPAGLVSKHAIDFYTESDH